MSGPPPVAGAASSDGSPQGSSRAAARLWRYAPWAIAVATVITLALVAARIEARIFAERVLAANENTWRDFWVYREVALGRLPLDGPSTSVGGHHGYLAYWIFGLWTLIAPGYPALQAFAALVALATVGCAFALARRVASAPSALLGAGACLCTTLLYFPAYPNHIVFMSLGTAIAFLGLLRARESNRQAVLAMAGVVLVMGSHRLGFPLLVAILVVDRAFRLGLLRTRWVWLPPALYLVPTGIALLLDRPTMLQQSLGTVAALREMDPWLLFRTMPFIHFRDEPDAAWQCFEGAVVVIAWAAAWHSHRDAERRALLSFYAVSFVFFLFYKYDGQYHLPMFALLPAVLALGVDGALRKAPRLGLLLPAALAVATVGAALHKGRFFDAALRRENASLHSILPELETVRRLDALDVGERDLYRRTFFGSLLSNRRLDYAHHLFSRRLDAPERPDRCVHVDWRDGVHVELAPAAPGRPCPSNLERFDGGRIWYLDLRARALRFD